MRQLFSKLEDFAHKHEHALHNMHRTCHMCYFGLIVFHGPYDLAAGALLIFGGIFWALGVME